METQANNKDSNKDSIAREIDNFKNEFTHLIKEKNVIIDKQARKIADLTLVSDQLKQKTLCL